MLRTSSHESRCCAKKSRTNLMMLPVFSPASGLDWRCFDQDEQVYERADPMYLSQCAGRSLTSTFITYGGKQHIFFINFIFINFKHRTPSSELWVSALMRYIPS